MRSGSRTLPRYFSEELKPRAAALAGLALLVVFANPAPRPCLGDEPGPGRLGLGRLFRFGGGSNGNGNGNGGSGSSITGVPPASDPGTLSPGGVPTGPASYPQPVNPPPGSEILGLPGPETVPPAPGGPAPRIIPRSRVVHTVTDADPIITRVTLNRSDNGNAFGMFLQVYADGTVLDSEGVHHVSQEALRPLIEALQAGDLYRQKGFCGSPATDYLESVHVVVYERSLGRLRANSFSYSGNPQGCDNAVLRLHSVLDNLQGQLSRPASTTAATGGTPLTMNASSRPAASVSPGPGPGTGPGTSFNATIGAVPPPPQVNPTPEPAPSTSLVPLPSPNPGLIPLSPRP